jgi:signal transduction histidine kinase
MLQLPFSFCARSSKAYAFSFLILSFLWGLFILSAIENYQSYEWFRLLLVSRAGLSFLAFVLSVFCFFREKFPKNLLFYFLLSCEWVQLVFGVLEGPFTVAFSEYVGILFLLSSLAYRSSFENWINKWALLQFLPFLILFFFKDPSLIWPLGSFVHHFSFIVVGVGLGLVVLRLNAERFVALEKNIILSAQLLKKEIEEKNSTELRFNFARQIAHDLKAPLAVLKLVLRREEVCLSNSVENKKLLGQVVTRIEKINSFLLSDPLRFDLRPVEGPISVSHAVKSLDLLVEEKRFLNTSATVQSFFTKNIQNTERKVLISEADLARVVSNLYDNAFEAFRFPMEKALIHLKVEERDNFFIFSLEDNASGIPQHIAQRVCEEGFSFNKKEGHGIGLFSVKQIIEKNGGKLTIHSEENKGTSIRIVLPLLPYPA